MNTFGSDGGLVQEGVTAHTRVALHDVQLVAVLVPDGVQSRCVAEASDVRHQRISLPVAA